ncbi:hypothetical protein LOZ39_003123 [Ophidiomyces ophidiicola]|uniref:Uncharacterized protein n=1 Tax=Ophidiomyces ophidiicola TaxID=1387563 RepID=A0ACB8V1A5_9EURO|nr:uncharacterized protein LOZ57_004317 [Ophidiomyces ophidiicola]KAI1908123.1 hypothetical protein LOZ64_005654 [Ophidiomyces ophidiicola]KAI1914860.1 hypothetical protein LOZ61_001997 [Ophidiomyces ophidiicola]KAI1945286.1 hypothetical protein LOZ57_004317 [Ophidiomyces ophidiicola]KAI1953485.1 hypothetical protein LOZ62_001042 [Ophidiomyces ophidiicola]KAI1957473.1 hypothetical protein LOZ59_003926 [Ophidiomyces ophidiicola]
MDEQKTIPFDAIVVGAGLSGLQAAYDIQLAGLSCLVLEARDRVGGKTWTRTTKNGKLVDVGAAWINDTNQSKIYDLAKRFNLDLIQQNTNGYCVVQGENGERSTFQYGNNPQFSPEEVANLVGIRELVEDLSHATSEEQRKYDDITFEQWVKEHGGGKKTLSTAAIWTRAMLGCEPSRVTAMYVFDYYKRSGGLLRARSDSKDGAQYLRIRQGTQEISRRLAASLKPNSVLLGSPVVNITQEDDADNIVQTKSGMIYHCKKVIISIPTPLYSKINFLPALPTSKTSLTDKTELGFYAKSILVYREPWWRQSSFCGLSQSFVGPASITRDTSDDTNGQYSLTCFLVGDLGKAWSKLAVKARREAILSQALALFGKNHTKDIYDVVDIVEQDWALEEWSQGAPCPVTGPGILSVFGDQVVRPFGNIHFVGTETAEIWKGYMDGAVRSGERGAKEIIESIKSRDTKL